MLSTTKTIYHTQLELARALQQPFVAMDHSTLNEKFNVFPDEEPNVGDLYPKLRYIAIGRGGHRGVLSSSGETLIEPIEHNVVHAALYEHVPFVVREVTNDLTPTERAKYGMRTTISKNGKVYFAYYLMAMDFASTPPEVEEITVLDGSVTTVPYVASPTQLNPDKILYNNDGSVISSGKHISVDSTLTLSLTEDEIAEVTNAIDVIYGDASFGTISEIGVVTAFRKSVSSTLGGIPEVTYMEAIDAQVANFIPTNIDLKFTTKGITQEYSLGFVSAYVR